MYSLAILISIALHPSRALVPKSIKEMMSELLRLWMQLHLMQKEMVKSKVEIRASNAHCTIMTWEASAVKTALEDQKCKTWCGIRTEAHLVVYSALEVQLDEQTLQKAQCAKEIAKVKAQKATEEALREAWIQEEIRLRTFTGESKQILHDILPYIFCRSVVIL
jgi:hypothetical protein